MKTKSARQLEGRAAARNRRCFTGTERTWCRSAWGFHGVRTTGHKKKHTLPDSWEIIIPPSKGTVEDDVKDEFPFPKVGCCCIYIVHMGSRHLMAMACKL